MTKLLTTAINLVTRLPDDQQDAIAQLILDEIADDERWDRTFARSQDLLARLADEAELEIGRGEVTEGDPGSLPG